MLPQLILLRPYQLDAKRNVFLDWKDYDRLLIMQATGVGKTVLYLAITDEIIQRDPKARVLLLSHRQELVYQPVERIQSFWPHLLLKTGVVMAESNHVNAQIVVATVQTLNSQKRLTEVKRHGDFDYIIIDECHHGVADSYLSILDAFPNAKVLGCTATPMRTDRLALGEVFQKVSHKYTIQDAVADGWLCPFTPLGFSVPVTVPEDWIPSDNEDNDTGELLSATNVLEIVFQKWREYAADRLTIGFTASVAQAHITAEFFNANGVIAAAIDGTTPDKDRKRILSQYKAGEIQALFNCMVLTEGFDAPETSCIMMLAPTRSDLVYIQRMGRGLRITEGKKDCMVLDFAPINARNIVMAGGVLDGVPKRNEEAIERAEEAGVLLYGLTVNDLGQAGYIDPMDVKAAVLDFVGKHHLAWTYDGVYATAAVNADMMLCIITPERDRIEKADELRRAGKLNGSHKVVADWIGRYRVYRLDKPDKYFVPDLKGDWSSMNDAKKQARDLASGLADNLGRKKANWRDGPMTDGQANYLRRLGGYQDNLTKGQAAQRISHLLAVKAVKQAESKLVREMIR